MNWTPEEINLKTSRLLDTMVSLAMEDNLVTDEEAVIIEQVRMTLWELESTIKTLLDLQSNEFKEKIQELFETSFRNIIQKARQDGVISKDENRLLKQIESFLRENGLSRIL